MEFVVNHRNTIYELKNNGLRLTIHNIIGMDDTLFLSVYSITGMRDIDLHTTDFGIAVERSKEILKNRIDMITKDANAFIEDDKYEIVKY